MYILLLSHSMCSRMQKVEEIAKLEEAPKLRKVSITPKEEPAKKEVKKTKVKIPKAKKYEELPEIPDYERPELEKYEESEFVQTKAGEKVISSPTQHTQNAIETSTPEPETKAVKNGLPKVTLNIHINIPANIFSLYKCHF